MSCWLISYGGGGDSDNRVRDSGVGDDWFCIERTDPALDSASNSYFEEEILVGDSRYSSCPAYTVY